MFNIGPRHFRLHDDFSAKMALGISLFPTECGLEDVLYTETSGTLEGTGCIKCLEVYFARLDGISVEEYKRRVNEQAAAMTA